MLLWVCMNNGLGSLQRIDLKRWAMGISVRSWESVARIAQTTHWRRSPFCVKSPSQRKAPRVTGSVRASEHSVLASRWRG